MILAGDVGGTKTNLTLFAFEGQALKPLAEESYRSKTYSGLEQVVQEFLRTSQGEGSRAPITSACFGVAGPVVGDRSKTPNLPWTVSTEVLRKTIGVEKVKLINDIEANGYGIPLLASDEFVTLQEGGPIPPDANGALISAGTGLGEAFLYREEGRVKPVASEGGHTDFAPRDELEIELLRYLLDRFRHVSYERVLSGPGLVNIYSFLRECGHGEEPLWLAARLKKGDPGRTISEAALADESELCRKALNVFVSIYGAEAGNLALKVKAVAGVYVGGGIAPKILEKLRDGVFMTAFGDKGRLSPLLKAVPVRVILNPKTALYGAARCATLLTGPSEATQVVR